MTKQIKINKNKPLKVVYNTSHVGYGLSKEALKMLGNNKNLERHHPRLIEVVEKLGKKDAGSPCANLEIHELSGTKYYIEEYNGFETVIELQDMIDASKYEEEQSK